MYKNLFTSGARAAFTGIACVIMLIACRKDNKTSPDPTTNPVNNPTGSQSKDEDSLKYLMYQIMQVTYADGGRTPSRGLPTYYWYSQVPSLNPLDSKYANADSLLSVMKTYAINPGTTKPYDHYSFLDRNGVLTNKLFNGVSAQTFAATNKGDFGFDYGVALDRSNNAHIYVLYADKNSPAGQIGVTRGWEIISVNGNSNINTSQAFLESTYNAIFSSSSVTLGFKRPDNTTFTQTLNTGSYNVNPVVFDSVLTVTNPTTLVSKKVGYFSMYTFSSVINSNGQATFTRTVLDQLFSKFQAQGVTSLIVDLRYNGGGAVSTAEYLDNAIAPASAAGNLMYHTIYNDKIMAQISDVKLTTTTNFAASTSRLTLDNVFFITSGSTASASELTLNNLKPYMTVKLVGEKTYGKPVGFIDFNISVFDQNHSQKYLADLYAINFETKNANGVGGYYTGIDVDAAAVDYVNVPWGSTTRDANLIAIVNYINTGSYTVPGARMATPELDNLRVGIPALKPVNGFNGMVDYERSRALRLNR
ncbi:S41 family peptidase [Chitinophaga sp. HK235]|uniref:S41 family peptidase n=1 Tax=Chitinophaga sp. HK235 TaxID=2952571 RepID=UPI001BA9E9E8|nr:S41 family peptidase [Chitinophaga sp. HK235]